MTETIFTWNKKHEKEAELSFPDDRTVQFSTTTAIVTTNEIITREDGIVCWEIIIDEFSYYSHIGYVDRTIDIFNEELIKSGFVASKSWGYSLQVHDSLSKISWVEGGGEVYKKSLDRYYEIGDRIGFYVDMNKSICKIYINGKETAIVSHKVPSKISPAVSNFNGKPGRYSIQHARF